MAVMFPKGENKRDTYVVHVAEDHAEYDFIFLSSVRHGFCKRSRENLAGKIGLKELSFSSVISGIRERK